MSSNSFLVPSLGFSIYSVMSSANNDSFTSSFLIWIPFISFYCVNAVARTSNTMLSKVARMGILVLFLILEGMLSAFHHWVWCWLWPFLCWGTLHIYILTLNFYHKWMLNFVKSLFCVYWDNHVIFILCFVNIMYHINWFAHTESSLIPWNRSHLIMVYDPLMYCSIWFANILLRIFASVFISGIGL